MTTNHATPNENDLTGIEINGKVVKSAFKKDSTLVSTIVNAKIEKDVEYGFNGLFQKYFNGIQIQHPKMCDGLIETTLVKRAQDRTVESRKPCNIIIEYKYGKQFFGNPKDVSDVLTQVVFYMKRIENNGGQLPNIAFVADENECFVIHTNPLQKYLNEDLDWETAPSMAHTKYPTLSDAISQDEEIKPFIFDVREDFSFEPIATRIIGLAMNTNRKIHITPQNIVKIFESFCKIMNDRKVEANDRVAIFVGSINASGDYYIHPNKRDTLVTPLKGLESVHVSSKKYEDFFGMFDKISKPSELKKFAEICDRLIEDENRRAKGEFYTPTEFVNHAHKMIAEQLGNDWTDEYVVYDPCCGTMNLTRDKQFRELYASTLEQGELDIANQHGYNPNATKFVFDFLNGTDDELMQKAPGLFKAMEENRKILFLMNPPYASACNAGTKSGTKGSIAITKMNEMMKGQNLGGCTENLFSQFFFRLTEWKRKYNLSNCSIAVFCKPIYLTGERFDKFRNYFLNQFEFKGGVLFNAGHFSNVSADWGINFSIWSNGIQANRNGFEHTLIDTDADGNIVEVGKKTMYNLDGVETMSDWGKESVKKLKTSDCPQMTCGVKWRDDERCRGNIVDNALGYYFNVANDVYHAPQSTSLYSSACSAGHGFSILDSNFDRVVCSFSARKLVKGSWINDKDEFMKPDETHPKYSEFVSNALIHSLFNTSSQQSSLRGIDYAGKKWDILNHFFFMSREEVLELADGNGLATTYQQALTDTDRYVYGKIKGLTLTETAQKVYDKACELVRKSFQYRSAFDASHPEYQILNWDCGWYQVKAVCKEYLKGEYDEFVKLYRALEEEMRPMVYELGFLKD